MKFLIFLIFFFFFFPRLAHSQAVCWLTSRMCNHGMNTARLSVVERDAKKVQLT